jgi:N-acetylglucosamine kinase-like BadF-type ATPase
VSKSPEDSHQPRAYLAVDGGGTKTHAVIVDGEGRPLGAGTAPGCNQYAIGLPRALRHIQAAVDAASRQACCSWPFTGAWFGLAGIDRPADSDALLAHLAPLAAEARVTNDAELVLAGLDGAPGVALIAGTGSIALGMDRAGRVVVRVGGWGHLVGDEGSGYDIGRSALQAALRMADGRAPERSSGALLDLVLGHFGVNRYDELMDRVYAPAGTPTVAALAPAVLRAARAGDPDARALARAAAGELARAAVAVAHKLPAGDPDTLALGGGLLVADTWYRHAVVQRIRRRIRLGKVVVVAEPATTAAQALARGACPTGVTVSRAATGTGSGAGVARG